MTWCSHLVVYDVASRNMRDNQNFLSKGWRRRKDVLTQPSRMLCYSNQLGHLSCEANYQRSQLFPNPLVCMSGSNAEFIAGSHDEMDDEDITGHHIVSKQQ